MKKYLLSKTLVIGVIILFVGASIVSGVNENVEKVSIGTKNGAKDTLDINDELLGYWSFDFETAEDESGNNNDGTVNGAVSVNGISGKALDFDGVNDYVDITDSSDFVFANQGLTFSAWVQIVDNADYYRGFMALADASDQYGLPKIILVKARSDWNDGRICFQLQTPTESTIVFSDEDGNTLPKNEWIYVVGVVDYPVSLKLYINGELQGSDSLVDFDMSDAGNLDLNFGSYPYPGWHDEYGRHNGLIDEVRIYDRALSEDEIQELYNNPGGLLKTTILMGRIHNLDTDVGNLMTFEALKLRCIQFSPFEFKVYSTGEKIKISEDYKGLLTPSFAFGIFNANV